MKNIVTSPKKIRTNRSKEMGPQRTSPSPRTPQKAASDPGQSTPAKSPSPSPIRWPKTPGHRIIDDQRSTGNLKMTEKGETTSAEVVPYEAPVGGKLELRIDIPEWAMQMRDKRSDTEESSESDTDPDDIRQKWELAAKKRDDSVSWGFWPSDW